MQFIRTITLVLFIDLAMLILTCPALSLYGIHSASANSVPVIFYTDIIAGPNSGGENDYGVYLTIDGKNFGVNRESSTVEIGGGEIADYMVWSDTKISVQIGSSVSSGDIVVTTRNGSATASDPFTVRPGDFYYISPAGNNAAGSPNDIAKPYRTPNYVMSLDDFDAGDFMVIRGGNYDLSTGNEGLVNSKWINVGYGGGRDSAVSGTSDTNAITIYGYPGESPVIDWGAYTGSRMYGIRCIYGLEYYVFANITFNLSNSGGVAVYLGFYSSPSQYLNSARMVNLTVKGGMAGAAGGVNTFSLQRADNFKLYGLDIGNQSSLALENLGSHIIYVSHFYTNGELAWSHIHDNSYGRGALQIAGDGWGPLPHSVEMGTWGRNTNVRIHDNLFENLPQEAIITNLGSNEIFVFNNIFRNIQTKQNGGFSPISFRGAGLNLGEYYFYNNTVYTNAGTGSPGGIIQLGYSPGSTYPEHVTIYNNIIMAQSPATHYFQINHTSFTTDKITADNNLWYGSDDNPPSWAGANSISQYPMFIDTINGDFRLLAGSPAIDAGIDVGVTSDKEGNPRPLDGDNDGTADYDIGAYEFKDTSTVSSVKENINPNNFISAQNYPNPFSQFTIINLQLSIAGNVVVKIYDMPGNEVAELVNEYLDAGSHSSVFDAAGLPEGMYYYTIRIGDNFESGKMVLVR